jgi:hypothetical protein
MIESDVKVIVNEAFSTYEEKTGLPRHEENLGNFREIFAILNRWKGFAVACTFIIGLPACIASLIVIVRAVKGVAR